MILIAFNKPVGVECTTDSDNPNNIINVLHSGGIIYANSAKNINPIESNLFDLNVTNENTKFNIKFVK